MVVRILDERYNPNTGDGDIYVTLEASELREFEVHMPVDHVLFVKKWDHMVLISHIAPAALVLLREPQPSRDVA